MHDAASATNAQADENEISVHHQTVARHQAHGIMKRAGMWRSIVLSSIGKTLFPYSKYIRTIFGQDLEWLLEEIERQGTQVSKSRDHIGQ